MIIGGMDVYNATIHAEISKFGYKADSPAGRPFYLYIPFIGMLVFSTACHTEHAHS